MARKSLKNEVSTEIKPQEIFETIKDTKKENKKTGNRPKVEKTENIFVGVQKAAETEEKRLLEVLKDVEPIRLKSMASLIKRAAFLSSTIAVLEADIVENGTTEWFTQSSNTPPYERQRPNSQLLNSYNSTYSKIMKQLSDLIPKQESIKKEENDGFDDFVKSRG